MASQTAVKTRMLVIPRGLEGFFYGRLSERYSDRRDVHIVVDRRGSDRRQEPRGADGNPSTERRSTSRRSEGTRWSLPDMPFAAS